LEASREEDEDIEQVYYDPNYKGDQNDMYHDNEGDRFNRGGD
jgi:hypothetical protein